MIDLKNRYKIAPDVLSQFIDKETVLLDLKNEFYFQLNRTGTEIWKLLQENNSLQEIINKLLQSYSISHENLEKDLRELVNDMVVSGVLITIDSKIDDI